MDCSMGLWLRRLGLAMAISIALAHSAAADDGTSTPPVNRLRVSTGSAAAFNEAVRGKTDTSELTPETTVPPTSAAAADQVPAPPARRPASTPTLARPQDGRAKPAAPADAAPPTAVAPAPDTAAKADAAPKSDKEPLEPIPDPQQGDPVAVYTSGFNGVLPGKTTVAQVEKAWGKPAEVSQQDNTLYHLYRIPPFNRVEVAFRQDRVASIVIRMDKAFPAEMVAQQLKLAAIHPVLVSNELGEILGQAFPERGVLFAFQPGDKPGKATMMVTQIILEPVSAEPFVLRAETLMERQADASLADLDQALKLMPQNARAHWLRCRVLANKGQGADALAAAEEAVRLDRNNPRYLITQAQMLASLQRFDEAIPIAQKAAELGESRPHIKARALCLLGDLYGSGVKPNYRKAIESHTEAIKVADPLANDEHPAIRLAAKEVLVDAHLGAANDIAWGNWNQKETAVPRWLKRARVFADDLIEHEGGTAEYRLRVSTRALAAVVGIQGQVSPAEWADETIRVGQELAEAAAQPQKARTQWTVGMALYDAVQVCQLRNENDIALKYGEKAAGYLENSLQSRADNATDRYILGRLYFRLGAIQAVGRQNHSAAIAWFEKAVPALDSAAGKVPPYELGRLGETFVSMGVSYWETNQRDRAISLTERGVDLMERAVKDGIMEESSLQIPYGNLASMHRQLGKESEAGKFLQKAARSTGTLQR